MTVTQMYGYYKELDKRGIILYFNGPISQSVVEGIADMMRQKMRLTDAGLSISQKVFGVLVEQMQNIINYSVDKHHPGEDGMGGIGTGQIVVGQDEGEFYVACGNKIEKGLEQNIRVKLEAIKDMDKDELKSYYKEQRRNGSDAFSKGAGLGFIEMARKASYPLDYKIEPINDEMSYFAVKATV